MYTTHYVKKFEVLNQIDKHAEPMNSLLGPGNTAHWGLSHGGRNAVTANQPATCLLS